MSKSHEKVDNISWEQRTVDEVISQEIGELERKLDYYEHLAFEQAVLYGHVEYWLEDSICDTQTKLDSYYE